jgi:hypothetical protein
VFEELKDENYKLVDELAIYIEVTYISGKPARSRGVELWPQDIPKRIMALLQNDFVKM